MLFKITEFKIMKGFPLFHTHGKECVSRSEGDVAVIKTSSLQCITVQSLGRPGLQAPDLPVTLTLHLLGLGFLVGRQRAVRMKALLGRQP